MSLEFLGMLVRTQDDEALSPRSESTEPVYRNVQLQCINPVHFFGGVTPPRILNSVCQVVPWVCSSAEWSREIWQQSYKSDISPTRHLVCHLMWSDRPADQVECKEPGSKEPKCDDRVRWLPNWWGRFITWCSDQGDLGPHLNERSSHINFLELLAPILEVKTFLKGQTEKRVLLLLDNSTVVAYINNFGGTLSPQTSILAG